jgi:mycofactocin biosynthesis protein MftB
VASTEVARSAPGTRVPLDARLELHPQVAVRPEPFGALVYHYGNRRLVFLKHPDVVAVVCSLGEHMSLSAALEAAGIDRARWSNFVKAIESLVASDIVREREP